VHGELACTSGSHEVKVRIDDQRMRLDMRQLGTLSKIVRSARAVGGLRALVDRLPAREVELALRGEVIARRTAGASRIWRLHPLGFLKALGSRA
jgi:hypothetical protein